MAPVAHRRHPGLAVWSIQHDSAPTLWRGHAMPLVDRANNLLSLLLTEPRLAQGGISFVAHSFGGIILQQLLRVAADRSPAEPQVAALLRRVRGITFLGTPHHGANLATWARIFWLVVRPSSAVDALATDDSNLRGLNQWFRRYALDTQIPIQTLVETKNTFLIKVVAAHSADPGLPSYPIPLDANHFDIAAPASRTSETYVHLRHFLTEPPTPVSPRGSLPDEFLQRTATRTDSNTTALQRVEQKPCGPSTITVTVAVIAPCSRRRRSPQAPYPSQTQPISLRRTAPRTGFPTCARSTPR